MGCSRALQAAIFVRHISFLMSEVFTFVFILIFLHLTKTK